VRNRAPGYQVRFPLDIASGYLEAKAGRLVVAGRVTPLEHRWSRTVIVGLVGGAHGTYRCWVWPGMDPWQGACSRGGAHDYQRDGQPCSHPLALAAWYLLRHPDGRAAAAALGLDQAAAAEVP